MKLTKLSAAWLPAWTCRIMPAPVNGVDGGTASQLIPGVRRTRAGEACGVYRAGRRVTSSEQAHVAHPAQG